MLFRNSVPVRPKALETRILLHPSAFIPDGPAAPLVFIADAAILDSSILSKITGSQKGTSPVKSTDSSGSSPLGCFWSSS